MTFCGTRYRPIPIETVSEICHIYERPAYLYRVERYVAVCIDATGRAEKAPSAAVLAAYKLPINGPTLSTCARSPTKALQSEHLRQKHIPLVLPLRKKRVVFLRNTKSARHRDMFLNTYRGHKVIVPASLAWDGREVGELDLVYVSLVKRRRLVVDVSPRRIRIGVVVGRPRRFGW